MEKVSRHFQMGQYLMVNGVKVDQTVWECANIQTMPSTQDPGSMDNLMVKE